MCKTSLTGSPGEVCVLNGQNYASCMFFVLALCYKVVVAEMVAGRSY